MDTQTRWRRFGDEQEPPKGPTPKEAPLIEAYGPAIRPGRVRVLLALLLIFVLAALIRMVSWQVIGANHATTSVSASADPPRGRIVDSHGLLLATDTFTREIWVSPRDYRNDKAKPDVTKIAALLGVPVETFAAALAQPGASALVAKNVSEVQCTAADKGKEVPVWVWCDYKRQRAYPNGPLGVHVLGLTDGARIGRSGVEGSFNPWLLALNDSNIGQLPAAGQIPEAWKSFLPSLNGHDLVLHLDAGLQYLVEKDLAEAIAEYEASSGTIIVMVPRTGAILALANWPSFDPNVRAQITDSQGMDAAVSVPYEPGSVFKIITYAAGLDTGLITPNSTFEDSGTLELSQQVIQNAEEEIYGTLSARDALARSVNTISAQISLKLGPDSFYRYVRQFGFGRPTEVDLANEVPGTVKRPGTEEWSQFEQATNSFGQGIAVTPIQLARAVAAIANDGVLVQPQMVKGLISDGTVHELPVRSMGRAIKPETAHTLTQMMVYTVDNYAAGPTLVPGYRLAGKTGTAEIPEQGGYTSDLTITTFAGFLPAADPKLVILVKLVEPRTSRWAEQVALPTFGAVARDAVQVLEIPPDDRMP